VHPHRLRGMADHESRIGAREASQLIRDLRFVPDEDDLEIHLRDRLHRAFDVWGEAVVPAHRINCNFHGRLFRP